MITELSSRNTLMSQFYVDVLYHVCKRREIKPCILLDSATDYIICNTSYMTLSLI